MPISLLLRRFVLLLLVGALAACRSERLAVMLPLSPTSSYSRAPTHFPVTAFSHPPKSTDLEPATATLAPAAPQPLPPPPVVAPERVRQAAATRHFPVLRRQLVAIGHGPATRRHDPRPRYFIHLWLTVSIILTVLLGLTIWGAVSSGLAGAILLGLIALVLAAADVIAIGGLLAGLADV